MPTPRRPDRTAARERPRTAHAARPSAAAGGVPEWAWWLAVPAAFAVLLWSCRGALPGTAVADDYSFLHALAFQRPLDWFDSMGATYYWRPVSRQLYFSLLGPGLVAVPGVAFTAHAALLLALAVLLYRIARRFASAPVAAAIACFPLFAEPARVLLVWPSGAQHLIAGVAAALAVHEALAGRVAIAAVAALAGVLSHESAALALPVIPFAAWWHGRDRRSWITGALAAGTVLAAWSAGYAVAMSHHVALPTGDHAAPQLAGLPGLHGRALLAALSLEDVPAALRDPLLLGHAALFVAAAVLLFRPPARARFAAVRPAALIGAAWFAAGVLPLLLLLPDWNAWRAWTPTLGFGVATGLLLGAASPALAGAWIALRLAGLLLSPAAVTVVGAEPPVDGSHESFRQITRLQRLTSATRDTLRARNRSLPRGASVAYFEIPRLAEFAFQGSRALQVWYRDSTLQWDRFGGQSGLTRPFAAGVEFLVDDPRAVAGIDENAMRLYQGAAAAMNAGDLAGADSLLIEAGRRLSPGRFLGSALHNRARIAFLRGDNAAADSLSRASIGMGLSTGDIWAFQAILALRLGDRARAATAVRRLTEREPNHPELPRILEAMRGGR